MTDTGRRAALCGLAGLLAAALLPGCATAARPGRALRVADGAYVVPGTGGAADEHNLGRIGNAGFIVGERAVLAIDTGTSYLHGQALLAEIAATTALPVAAALVTHTRPEFLFGGAAFRERGIPVHMHVRCATLMASRCETCLKTLRTTLGDAPLQGTAMYQPDRTFDAGHEIDLGGRTVQVLYFGHSSGPGDVAVLDVRSNVLFAGGLLDAGRIPDIQDSELAGWHAALDRLRALRVGTVVPGHGPAASSAVVIDGVDRYLRQLEARLRAMVESGASLLGAAEAAELPEFTALDQYDTIHRRNASVAFLRFERELLFK